MDSGLAAFDNVGGLQERKSLQPVTSLFDLAMPELPRLDVLVRLSDASADNGDGILQCDARDRSVEEGADKRQSLLLLDALVGEPSRT
tara:strand:+ start:9800 stop:10063 length:264 start_codon:yes stop_codon:yes gene_type:complete